MSSSPNTHPVFKYRPEVDGLRAISVLAVLFFHAGLGFPGGFVGVDVFFVISGFLVTSLIFKDLDAGTFSFGAFWERRARRILPAALVMTLVVLVVGWFLLLPIDFKGLGQASIAQALFSANIYFWKSIDYFSGSADELPLLHTWSLAVEEQFYFVAPAVFVLLYRLLASRRRNTLVAVLGIAFTLSLAGSAFLVHRDQNATFYLLPTRAWELLAGSIVAILPTRYIPRNKAARESASWLGFIGLLSAICWYDRETLFPGLAALPPCIGAALIIWSNGHAEGSQPTPLTRVGRILAAKPVVFIGLISYSLYLWHWPLLAFSRYWAAEPLSLASRCGIVILSVALAILSWHFVETPFRQKRIFGTRRSILLFAASGLATVLAAGLVMFQTNGLPRRMPPEVTRFDEAKRELVPIDNRDASDVLRGNLAVIGQAREGEPIDFLLWGDSHARTAQPAFDAICLELGLNGRAATHSATTPLLGFFQPMKHGLNEKALAFGEAIFNYVKANRIPKVFLVCRWQGNDMSNGNFEQAFINTVNAFRAINVKVFVMLQVPSHKVDVPKKLALNALLQKDDLGWRTTVEEHQQTHAKLIQLSKNLGSETCVFLDPAPAFLEPDGDHYGVSANGESLYVDHHHLTKHAARTKLYPLLKPALADLSQLATRPQEANTYGSIPRDAVLGSRAP